MSLSKSVFLLLLLVLAGCSDSDGDSGSEEQSNSTPDPVSKGVPLACNTCPNPTPEATPFIAPLGGSLVTISGRITYDRVPHNAVRSGLDYDSIIVMPVRGANLVLLDSSGDLINKTKTDDNGEYQIEAPENTAVRVRVLAELQNTGDAPNWDFSVTDNTSGNALYALDGGLTSSGDVDSNRDLHAPSGWTGSSYGQPRAAAPFAILDSVNDALQFILGAQPHVELPRLELRWSVNNIASNSVDGRRDLGLIGTSLYDPSENNIYLLGDEDNDTDEYDASVILHEFVHYLEDTVSRSDSVGGFHTLNQKLDMRLVYSEGLANALSGVFLRSRLYRDARSSGQSEELIFDLESNFNGVQGWFNENSIQSFIYDIYDSENDANDELSLDFESIFGVISSEDYINNSSLISIYTFADELMQRHPEFSGEITSMLNAEFIFGEGNYGENETNDGENAFTLPVYKTLSLNSETRVCTNNREREFSGLGVSSFLRLNLANAGNYQLRAESDGTGTGQKDPDFIIYRNGITSRDLIFQSSTNDLEVGQAFLEQGEYVIELYEWTNRDNDELTGGTACFNVSASRI